MEMRFRLPFSVFALTLVLGQLCINTLNGFQDLFQMSVIRLNFSIAKVISLAITIWVRDLGFVPVDDFWFPIIDSLLADQVLDF